MRTAVVYKSITGFTKKYAEWIAEELNADRYPREQVSIDKLLDYDLIIFGGSLHAVGINGIDIIKDNMDRLSDKKLIVFATGASPARENVLKEVLNNNFSPEEQKRIRFFYLRGGFDYSKLNVINKILMTLMKWKLSLKRERTPDEKGMLAAYSQPVNFTKKERLKDLLDYAKSLSS